MTGKPNPDIAEAAAALLRAANPPKAPKSAANSAFIGALVGALVAAAIAGIVWMKNDQERKRAESEASLRRLLNLGSPRPGLDLPSKSYEAEMNDLRRMKDETDRELRALEAKAQIERAKLESTPSP